MAEIETWITIHGVHVPIMKGSSRKEAISHFLNGKKSKDSEPKTAKPPKTDEDIKNKQIELNKEQANKAKQSEETSLQKVDASEFGKALNIAKDTRPASDKWRVDSTHTTEDFNDRGCQCFTSKGGSTVAVDRDGDIISVCKSTDDSTMNGTQLLAEAVKMGGRKLDSFDGNHGFYVKCGFEPTSYTTFNEEYAPEGWKESGCGREDVVFYRYVGVGKVQNTDLEAFKRANKPFTGEDGYDNAMKYRDNIMKRR